MSCCILLRKFSQSTRKAAGLQLTHCYFCHFHLSCYIKPISSLHCPTVQDESPPAAANINCEQCLSHPNSALTIAKSAKKKAIIEAI